MYRQGALWPVNHGQHLNGQKLALFVPHPMPHKKNVYREIVFLEIQYSTVGKSSRLRPCPASLAIKNGEMFPFRVGSTYNTLHCWTAILALGHNTINI